MLLATQLERVFILKDNGQEIKLPYLNQNGAWKP